MMDNALAPAQAGGPLVPATDRMLGLAAPERLWRVRLEDGAIGWWKRDVTPRWRLPFALHRRARAQREFAALRLLRERGLAAPEPLAWSERRIGGVLLESALLTREVPDVLRLDRYLQQERVTSRRAAALEAVGALVARIHARGIGHLRLQPKSLHVEVARPDRAWILDSSHACAWPGAAPRRIRLYDLCTLAGPKSGLGHLEAEALIEAYERHGGTVTEGRQLRCANPCAMRLQRIAFFLTSIWSRHRPELFLRAATASR